MSDEPRTQEDYSSRQVEAARRVLVDLGQVLGSFKDCLVLVGGWVPDLLLKNAEEPHVGSIDVDLALDAERLGAGRYAKLIQSLINTHRYKLDKEDQFKLVAEVDLGDGKPAVRVDVDFLKSAEVKTKKNTPKLIEGFRPLDAAGCKAAFEHPELVVIAGQMIKGQRNTTQFRVASIADFLLMKSYALAGRDKPKDAYDIFYCLQNYPGGMKKLAGIWKARHGDRHVGSAIKVLKEKFASTDAYGPGQVVEFYNFTNDEEKAIQARRAYELVQTFLKLVSAR